MPESVDSYMLRLSKERSLCGLLLSPAPMPEKLSKKQAHKKFKKRQLLRKQRSRSKEYKGSKEYHRHVKVGEIYAGKAEPGTKKRQRSRALAEPFGCKKKKKPMDAPEGLVEEPIPNQMH